MAIIFLGTKAFPVFAVIQVFSYLCLPLVQVYLTIRKDAE
jgi:hypothetical protein